MVQDERPNSAPKQPRTPDRPPMMMEGEMVVGSVIEDTLVLVLGIGSATNDQVTAFLNGDPAMSVKTNLITGR